MEYINGKNIAWQSDINFNMKVVNIDFYNTNTDTIFLGHVGDHNLTLLKVIIPPPYNVGYNVQMKVKDANGTYSATAIVPQGADSGEYYFPITSDYTEYPTNGYIQFFIEKTETTQRSGQTVAETIILASTKKIPYIVETSIEYTAPFTPTELQATSLQSFLDEYISLKARLTQLEAAVAVLQGE